MAEAKFDVSLPLPYSENWREAYRKEYSQLPRISSYQAPGGEPIPFIWDDTDLGFGQAVDTEEYPFHGLWSNESLNKKPQTINIKGFLRGPTYIGARNILIEALSVPTDDASPGYIDLPFWGRFPIVVVDGHVRESAKEQGQAEVSITFTRAGVSITDRLEARASGQSVESASKKLRNKAEEEFAKTLGEEGGDNNTLASGFLSICRRLSSAVSNGLNVYSSLMSGVERVKTTITTVTNKIAGIQRMVSEGVRAPLALAASLNNTVQAIVSGFAEIKNAFASYSSGDEESTDSNSGSSSYPLPEPDDGKKLLLQFISESAYTPEIQSATVAQERTKKAMENLSRTMAYAVSAELLASMENITFQEASGFWNLLEKLEAGIDAEPPEIQTALTETRIAVSQELSRRDMSRELSRGISAPMPLLPLAHSLSCDEAALRRLNSIADSFVIEGVIAYV
jgi:prophage DNA circulation protein